MDKESLSQYGWVVILIIILCILMGMATPFGNYVKSATMSALEALRNYSYDDMGIEIPLEVAEGYFTVDPENGALGIKLAYQYDAESIAYYQDLANENGCSVEEYLRYSEGDSFVDGSTGNYRLISQEDFEKGYINSSKMEIADTLNIPSETVSAISSTQDAYDAIYINTLGQTLADGEHATEAMINQISADLINANEEIVQIRSYVQSWSNPMEFIRTEFDPPTEEYVQAYYRILCEPSQIKFEDYLFIKFNDIISLDLVNSTLVDTADFNTLYKATNGYTWGEYVKKFTTPDKLPTSFAIPENIDGTDVKTIPSSLFSDYSYIQRIQIPNTVTNIGNNAFSGCSSLKSVMLSNNIVTLNSNTFKNCTSLSAIKLPDGIETINNEAFSGCTSLKTVSIPSSLSVIGDRCFLNCSLLSDINLSDVNDFGDYSFSGCRSITELSLDNDERNRIQIHDGAFENSGLSSVVINSHNEYEKDSHISINVCDKAFANCTNLSTFVCSGELVELTGNCFSNASQLNEISVSEYVCFGSGVFDNASIKTIKLTPSQSALKDREAYGEFCTSYSSSNYCNAKNCVENIIVTDGVSIIPDSFMKDNTTLKSVVFPDSLRVIGYEAFRGCTGLTSIHIPDGFETFGYYCFSSCTNLASINFPSSIINYGSYSFNTDPVVIDTFVIGPNCSNEPLDVSSFKSFTIGKIVIEKSDVVITGKLNNPTIIYSPIDWMCESSKCYQTVGLSNSFTELHLSNPNNLRIDFNASKNSTEYSYSLVPWNNANSGSKIYFDDTFTYIGNGYISNNTAVDYYFTDSVTEISDTAFAFMNRDCIIHAPSNSYVAQFVSLKGLNFVATD